MTTTLANTHWRDNLRYLKGLDGTIVLEDDYRTSASRTELDDGNSPFQNWTLQTSAAESMMRLVRNATDDYTLQIMYSGVWKDVWHDGNLSGSAHEHTSEDNEATGTGTANLTVNASWQNVTGTQLSNLQAPTYTYHFLLGVMSCEYDPADPDIQACIAEGGAEAYWWTLDGFGQAIKQTQVQVYTHKTTSGLWHVKGKKSSVPSPNGGSQILTQGDSPTIGETVLYSIPMADV